MYIYVPVACLKLSSVQFKHPTSSNMFSPMEVACISDFRVNKGTLGSLILPNFSWHYITSAVATPARPPSSIRARQSRTFTETCRKAPLMVGHHLSHR